MRYQRLIPVLCVWLLAACDKPERVRPASVNEQGEAHAASETAVATPVHVVDAQKPTATVVAEQAIGADTIELTFIVKPMLSRRLFKLDPASAQAYFADIAALRPQPSDEEWLKRYEGTSNLPWLESVLVELQEDGDHWRLGQCQVTWRPPEQQALALYEKLAAEVRAVRGRKPSFQRDESKSGKLQRSVGWKWCEETCEAIVALDSDGRSLLTSSAPTDENHPAVSLTIYTPEGP